MPVADEDAIDDALRHWRQGDITLDPGLEFVFLADLSHPHSPGSIHAVETDAGPLLDETVPLLESVRGLAVLTQSCDVVRGCQDRPFVEVAPLVEVSADHMEDVRRLRRPRFAYCPATAREGLVVDLDRTMTVEKAVVAGWTRTPGCASDEQVKDFALALGRKRSRAAFPDDFAAVASYYGVGIVTDAADSPHLQARGIKGELYLAFASDDPYVPRDTLDRLPAIMAEAGVEHRIEVYPETEHGFAFPERAVYRKAAAERHWERMFALFSRRLAAV